MGGKGLVSIAVTVTIITAALTACGPGYSGKLFERSAENNVYLEGENVGRLREPELLQKIRNYASKVDRQPQDAELDGIKWEVAKAERPGKRVNIEKTLELLLKSNEDEKARLVIEEIKPGITSQKLKDNIVEIGTYSTPLLDSQEPRVNNIELASDRIDFKKLAPGEEFSFNKIVGKRTGAKGYELAPIIIKAEHGYKKGFGIGGGVCQLATTLYNAAEKCGMEITERHIHSKDVGYVPEGKDATVSYGAVDFKFRNNRSFPVMIRIHRSKNALTIKLYENRN